MNIDVKWFAQRENFYFSGGDSQVQVFFHPLSNNLDYMSDYIEIWLKTEKNLTNRSMTSGKNRFGIIKVFSA